MRDERSNFLSKAREALTGAEIELTGKRYNNAANRAYYACFFAAIVALMGAGIRPQGEHWEHDFVAAQFAGVLIHRRKLYSAELRDILYDNMSTRRSADYESASVAETETKRAIRRAKQFVLAVEMKVRTG